MARHGIWTETGGGGGWEPLVGGVLLLFAAAVALQAAAAVASAVATILITLFWIVAILVAVLLAALVAYIVLRLRRGLPVFPRQPPALNGYGRPLGTGRGPQPVRRRRPAHIEPPPLAALTDDVLAAEIRRRIEERG